MLIPDLWHANNGDPAEYLLRSEIDGPRQLLIIPALFDEANKLRHFTVDTMRRLAEHGVATLLPDLPGMNESRSALDKQTLGGWGKLVSALAATERVDAVLAFRGGALLAPAGLRCLALAPVTGASQLRGMLRARVLADRENGRHSTRESLLEIGEERGLDLAGHAISAQMVRDLQSAELPPNVEAIAQSELGGPGLWLRAEPEHDPAQAERLALYLADALL